MRLTNIFVHSFGGVANDPYAKTQNLTEAQINNAHKTRFDDFISSLGSYIGYNFIIWADGTLKQYRKLGEETAAQVEYNSNSVSICLAGNFTKLGSGAVERPTAEQVMTLKNLELALLTKSGTIWDSLQKVGGLDLDIKLHNIKPHRSVAPHKSCYGDLLSDSWARDLAIEAIQYKLSVLQKILILYTSVLDIMKKLQPRTFGSGKSNNCLDD